MRAGPPDEVLAGACTWRARVTSWLGGRMLAAQVPIIAGRITAKVDDDIIESLSISVPRYAAPAVGIDVIDWRPGAPDAPLARYGQALDVSIIVGSVVTGQTWETRVGRYQVKDWEDDDAGLLTVKGESLLARPRDDKLAAPTSPTGTFMSEVRRLLPAGMGASFASALVDRACPQGMSWSEDRLAALQEIAAAWPALLRVDEWGQVRFAAPLPATPAPIVTVKDGAGGTLISAPRSDTRSVAYNQVVASTSATDKPDVVGIASVASGPMSVNGPYGVVTKKWSSSLLDTADQATAAAQTMLANSMRPAAAVPTRIAPDPRIQLDDPIEILRGASGHMETVPAVGAVPEHRKWVSDTADESADAERVWGWVTAYDLPLTTGDGEMRVDVGLP